MSGGLSGVFATTLEVAVPPEIAGAWEMLAAEATSMAAAAGGVQTAVDEAAGSWTRLASSYDEPSTNAVVHRAMDPLVPRAGAWSTAMTAAGTAVEDFARRARRLQARAEELIGDRGEVLQAAAEVASGDAWVETWWQRLRVAEFNAAVDALRQEWDRAQQHLADELAVVERDAAADGVGGGDGSLDVADEAALDPGTIATGGSSGGRSGAVTAEQLVDELAGAEPQEIIERLDDEEAAATAAALADRRLDAQFALPGHAARRMREVMATHDHRTEAGMRAIREEFLGLEAEQQRRLVVAYPAEFGNLNGIPLAMRARANAVRVAAMRHRLDRGAGPEAGAEAERRRTLRSGLDQAAGQIAAGRSVVHLSARGRGEVVVMDGVPTEETERTLIHVPGTGADPSELDEQVARVEALDGGGDQTAEQGGALGTVSVWWQGAQLPPDLSGNVELLDPGFDLEAEMERGARNLTAFDRALDLEVGEQVRSTVSAHSAGTAYMGRAAHRDLGLTADALVYIAPSGPGRGVSSREDLIDDSTEVYRVEARDDAVDPVRELLGWQGLHGRAAVPWQDPMDGLEAVELEPGAADRTVLDDGELPELVSDAGPFAAHSGVLDEDAQAVESIRAIVAGGEEQVLPLYEPGDPRLPEEADGHEVAVRRRLLEDHEERDDWLAVEDLSREAATR